MTSLFDIDDSIFTENRFGCIKILGIPITRAYSSNLGRAVETAEVLLEDREVELVYDKRLKEINFGIMEEEYKHYYFVF